MDTVVRAGPDWILDLLPGLYMDVGTHKLWPSSAVCPDTVAGNWDLYGMVSLQTMALSTMT